VQLPEGSVLISDPETLVVSVVLPTVASSDDETAETPAAAAETPAEGAAAEEAAE
jgi:large subunit ribosomal protein L25